MKLFYKVSDNQMLNDRNELFKEVGIPALTKNGFSLSPFNGAWHGEFDSSNGSYNYDFCRITQNIFLEILDVSIHNKDRRINIYLCIFEFTKKIDSIDQLRGFEGTPFAMTVKNKDKYIQLRLDEYKGPPLFYMFFLPEHKIARYYTKSGYKSRLEQLKKLIKSDMESIDEFIKRWHELFKPTITDWEGNIIKEETY